jgi:hypothetical protein
MREEAVGVVRLQLGPLRDSPPLLQLGTHI